MAEVNIKTRLSLRYDTLANWNSANPVLNKGEVAVVAIPSGATGENNTWGQDTKPSILFKVGDGKSNFKDLPYASGRAADVYAWAKAATKPTYTASEVGAAEEDHIHTGDSIYIGGNDSDTLEDWAQAIATNIDSRALSSDVYTKSQVDTKIKEIQGALEADTNTQYKLEWNDSEKLLVFSSKDIGGNWAVVTKLTPGSFTLSSAAGTELSGKTFDAVISGLSTKVTDLEQNLETYYATKDNVKQAVDDIEVGLANGAIEVYAAGRAAMDGAGKNISTTYATKEELNSHAQLVGPQISALQGNFTEGAANKAIADKNGKDITTTYATQAALGSVRDSLQDLEGITQTLEGYFTSEGVALEADKATKDGAGNVIATTYATKAELAQDLDELDYESVGAAPLSHTHSASEINYLGNKISAASGKTIQVAVDTVYDGLSTHTSSKANPHGVTAAQVGAYTKEEVFGLIQEAATNAEDALRGHSEASNPHNITKSTVGLGNVLNVASYAKTETYTQDEVDDAIAAESKVITDGLATGAVQVYAAGRAAMDGAGQTISTTYATKTELTTGLSGKADSSALSQQVSRLEGLIDDAVEEVTEVANGKTKTFVTSKTNKDSSYSNSVLNSQNADVTITPSSKILLIDGTSTLSLSELKLGDIILVKETDVPDRWVSAISSTSATLSKMETSKVDLTPYVLASTIINGKTLEDDIYLTGDDIGIANDDGTSTTIADKFSEVDEYIADFVSGDKTVGHAEQADKATQDGDGNVIKDTYATKTQLNTLGTAFESVEWALFNLSGVGQVTVVDESTKINAKLNEYMSNLSKNNLKDAQIIERGLKFVMVDPKDIRWQGHINGVDLNMGLLSIKFECDATETISPYNGYDITVVYKSGVVINSVLERRFNPGDVYILNGGNAAGAY